MTFRRPPPKPAKQLGDGYTLRPRAIAEAVSGPARMSVPVPKKQPVRHEGYRRLVASLPCAVCHREGRSQAAHPNQGKGLAIKADDRLCFPLCADEPGRRGCHSQLDQGGGMTKEQRRMFECFEVLRTQATISDLGLWPANLPQWQGDEL